MLETPIKYLRNAEIGQELYSSLFGVCTLCDFMIEKGNIYIMVKAEDGCYPIKYNCDGTFQNSNEMSLFPDKNNQRWDHNWKWRVNNIKRGDILVTNSTIFMCNEHLFKSGPTVYKPCALAAYFIKNKMLKLEEGALGKQNITTNRWTDGPVSPANDKEINRFFKLFEEQGFVFDKENGIFKDTKNRNYTQCPITLYLK